MSYEQTTAEAPPTEASPQSCSCDEPVLGERPGYKGASRLYCERCDLPVRIRLR